MAKLQFLSVFMILMSRYYVDGQGVRFSLRGTTYQNNSLVTLENIGDSNTLALLCETDSTACCRNPARGDWFFPNGTAVPNAYLDSQGLMWDFYRNRNTGPGLVRMIRRRGRVDGIYLCVIPNTAGVDQTIYIGVYTATSGVPQVTSLTFNDQSRTLTCTSTGGPATTVTWRRDGAVITLSATYQQTKRVVDLVTGTYQTVLTIDPLVGQSDIVGTYNCTVENVRGRSSMTVVITGPLQPSNLMSTVITHNTATILWTVSMIAYTPETYTVHFGTSPGSLIPFNQQRQSGDNFTATNLQFSVQLTGLSVGTTYYYQVVAVNSVGSTASVEQRFTTMPASPENVMLTTTSSPLRVTWTIDPPDGLVSNYTIYVTRVERGSTVVNYTSTNTQLLQFDILNLDPYELVEVSVSASNSAGESPRSPGVRGRTREERPGIVNNCPSRWTDLASAIQVTWTAPERPNGLLLRYHLQLTSYNGRRVITTESVGSGTLLGQLDSSELQDGVPYIVSIFAENSAGNGTKCNVTDFTDELPPLSPSNVMVTHVSGTIIRVTWQPLSLVEARGHIIYRVMVAHTTGSRRRRQAAQRERVCTLLSPCEVPANESSVIVVGLDRDTSYTVTVMAVNSEGEAGPTSVPITATIPARGGIDIGTMVGVVVALVVVIIIMGVVIVVLVARNRCNKFPAPQHAVKDEPVKWSEVASSGDTNVTTTECEAYGTVNQGHEYEVPKHTGQQPPGTENEIPVIKSPAYVSASEQNRKVEK